MLVKRISIDAPFSASSKKFLTAFPRTVTCLQFPGLLGLQAVDHAVCTRHGGVSPRPFDSLNAGFATGDDPGHVSTNIEIARKVLGSTYLVYLNQKHGTEILSLHRDRDPLPERPADGDAIITDMTDVALMVKQADCQAVILHDPVKKVIANVHCGWRGNARNILGAVVERMSSDFGSSPADVVAAIGPSLGPCCAEFLTHGELFPRSFLRFMVRDAYFDLWEISRWQLTESGLKEENIELAGICTRCRTDLFYSYRAEGLTGRFATLVALRDD